VKLEYKSNLLVSKSIYGVIANISSEIDITLSSNTLAKNKVKEA